MFDAFERDEAQYQDNSAPKIVGVTLPAHAFQVLTKSATHAPDLPDSLGSFAAAVVQYAHLHPDDHTAA